MPSWKKVAVSGSDASFNSLYVTGAVTASIFSGSFVGDGAGLTNLTYGDFATASFSSQATWSFAHNIGYSYVAIEVFDQNDFVVIPSAIKIVDANNVDIYFTSPQSGTALATLGTGVVTTGGGGTFNTSSLLITASAASNVITFTKGNGSTFDVTVDTGSVDLTSYTTTSSFNAFTASYTTGSFTGSFTGDGSQLTGIVSSKWTGSNPISRQSDVEITGSLRVTGGVTASLFGTASWASNASTASYVENAQTASYVTLAQTASYVENAQTASYVLQAESASFASTASFVTTAQTASYVLNAISSSFATSASWAPSSPAFPFTGSALITGSLGVTGSISTTQNFTGSRMFLSASNSTVSGSTLTVYGSGSAQPVFTVQGSSGELFSVTDSLTGSLFSVNDISGLPILEVFSDNTTLIGNYLDPMLITTAKVTQTNSGSFTVYSLPTASYDTAFFEYSVKSGSNARAGTIMAIQSGSSVNFTETTTTDFGNTTAVSFTVLVTGSNMALTGSSTTGAWTTKCIIRGI